MIPARKNDQNFDAQRAAVTKRRRKRAANLHLAATGQIGVVVRQVPGILWTPPRTGVLTR